MSKVGRLWVVKPIDFDLRIAAGRPVMDVPTAIPIFTSWWRRMALFPSEAMLALLARNCQSLLGAQRMQLKPDVLDDLLGRLFRQIRMLSHLRSVERYDEPETIPSSIRPFCLMSRQLTADSAGPDRAADVAGERRRGDRMSGAPARPPPLLLPRPAVRVLAPPAHGHRPC